MRRLLLLGLALLTAFGAVATAERASPAQAQEIEVASEAANNRFPEGIRLTIFLSSNAEFSSVRLRYRVVPDGTFVTVTPECTTGTFINCSVDIGATRETYLVPGAEVRYVWEVVDAADNRLTTEERAAVYEDDRFEWETFSEGPVTIYAYTGSEEFNRQLLTAAAETLTMMGRVLQTEIEFPIKVWVYANPQDLASAIASTGGQGITHGQVSVSDTALVARSQSVIETVRHEVAHLVTRRASRSDTPIGDRFTWFDVPSWINEGISVYAQGRLTDDQAAALDLAVRSNKVLPLPSLGGSTQGAGDTVSLFYGESGSVMAFLINTHGEERFAQFLQALKTNRTSEALDVVYGFDLLGLENQWRAQFNLPPVEAPDRGQQSGSGAIPTLVPFGAQQPPTATPDAEPTATAAPTSVAPPSTAAEADDDGGSSVLPLVAGAAVVLALVAGGGYVLLRRRKASA